MKKLILALLGLILCQPIMSFAQKDTVEVSLTTFVEQGIENSGQLEYEKQKIRLADNRIDQARSKRYLPKFELNTQHGVVPGVESNVAGLSENEYYLDPNLENDWENWAVFTRAEVTAIQPLFSWGALKNAVKAAKKAAVAAREQFQREEANLRLKLFELYQSYLLASEIVYLLDDAESKIDEIEEKIEEREKDKDSEIDESDVFKFKVYKNEFKIRSAEVRENVKTVQRIWNYVLQADDNTVYVPDTYFLDPLAAEVKDIGYYRSNALSKRAELKAINAGVEAAEFGLDAIKQKNYPMLFLGLSASYANTPNRPRQSNPFIINNSNYATASFGLGIRQNLNFWSVNKDIEKGRIQKRQAKYLKQAAVDGIVLEINDAYKKASLSKIKVDRTDDAFVVAKKWLRQEQLDYDFGMGNTKDLVDAMKKELELRVKLKQEIFDFNKNIATLYRKAGIPLTKIWNND